MKTTEILPPEQKAAGSNPAEGTEKVGPDQHNAGTGPFFGPATAPQTAPYEPNSTLTEQQLDGHACARCGCRYGPGSTSAPDGYSDDGRQLFACSAGWGCSA